MCRYQRGKFRTLFGSRSTGCLRPRLKKSKGPQLNGVDIISCPLGFRLRVILEENQREAGVLKLKLLRLSRSPCTAAVVGGGCIGLERARYSEIGRASCR